MTTARIGTVGRFAVIAAITATVVVGVFAAVRRAQPNPASATIDSVSFIAPVSPTDATSTTVAANDETPVAATVDSGSSRGPVAVIPSLGDNGFPRVPAGDPVALLDTLVVDETDAPVPYQRQRFGPGWADPDGNGCTGRQQALIDHGVTGTVVVAGRCAVTAVTLESLYDGVKIVASTSADVGHRIQVDHIVPVRDAFRRLCCVTGPDAQHLRELFYNDPENLLPVSPAANQAKSDHLFGDPRFTYVTDEAACYVAEHTVRVKSAYALPITANEAAALRTRLATCATAIPST